MTSAERSPHCLRRCVGAKVGVTRSTTSSRSFAILVHSKQRVCHTGYIFTPCHRVHGVSIFNSTHVEGSRPTCRATERFTERTDRRNCVIVAKNKPNVVRTTGRKTKRRHSFNLGVALPCRRASGRIITRDSGLVGFCCFFIEGLGFITRDSTVITFPKNFKAVSRIFRALALVRAKGTAVCPVILLSSPNGAF